MSDQQTREIIGAAIEVHRHLDPGLLESVYEECLCFELKEKGIPHARQVPLPISYKGNRLDCGYRMDVVAFDEVIIEVKSVDKILPIHEAQILTYLKLSGRKIGLLMNFNSETLKTGIKRIIH